jgi:hypothetical protein
VFVLVVVSFFTVAVVLFDFTFGGVGGTMIPCFELKCLTRWYFLLNFDGHISQWNRGGMFTHSSSRENMKKWKIIFVSTRDFFLLSIKKNVKLYCTGYHFSRLNLCACVIFCLFAHLSYVFASVYVASSSFHMSCMQIFLIADLQFYYSLKKFPEHRLIFLLLVFFWLIFMRL